MCADTCTNTYTYKYIYTRRAQQQIGEFTEKHIRSIREEEKADTWLWSITAEILGTFHIIIFYHNSISKTMMFSSYTAVFQEDATELG